MSVKSVPETRAMPLSCRPAADKNAVKIFNLADIQKQREQVARAADAAFEAIKRLHASPSAYAALYEMKFKAIGTHPLEMHPLNMIEQLNQMFTILASLAGAEKLLALEAARPLVLNPGARAGHDITSGDGEFVAEVFAAVDPANNKKLEKDIERLRAAEAKRRYLFYYTPSSRDVSRITGGLTDVIVRRLTSEELAPAMLHVSPPVCL